ncbi:MAG: DUF2004 domain-containing protein [Gammaproteobacteria bacterium]|nr:DUF2004 domain-containing protein [Gammaproteobacteria bacterium]
MTLSKEDLERYEKNAISAINDAYGTEEGETSVTQFVTYHMEEIDDDFWQDHLGTSKPEPGKMLEILELVSQWSDGDAEVFEFSLPDKGTPFVISVQFDNEGHLVDIAMDK